MMRYMIKLFPPRWRDTYGGDLVDQFESDPRVTKWLDLLRTAAGLWWDVVRTSRDGLAAGLLAALALAAGCDLLLGVGMDERIAFELLSHWWAAPFAFGLAISALVTVGVLLALVGSPRRRRRLALLTVGVAVVSFVGSAIAAAVSFGLAGLGAALGLVAAVAGLRAILRAPLCRGDAIIAAAVPMIVLLGWQSASSPIGPLYLVLVTGALLTTRVDPRPEASTAS